MSRRTSDQRDEVLESNTGFLWLAGLFFVPAALLLVALATQIGRMTPFGFGSLAILIAYFFESHRPTYPYRILRVETPPAWLTAEQRRVLTFVKSADAHRSRQLLCIAMVALTGLVTVAPFLFGAVPGWVSHYLFIRSNHALNDSAFFLFPLLFFQLFSTYCALFGWGCRQALRQWDRIQAQYEPWPLDRIGTAFRLVTPPHTTGEDESRVQTQPPVYPRVPLSPNMSVSGSQVLAVVCFLSGGPGLFIGATRIVRDFMHGTPAFRSRVILDLCLVVIGLALIQLGRYLWHRG